MGIQAAGHCRPQCRRILHPQRFLRCIWYCCSWMLHFSNNLLFVRYRLDSSVRCRWLYRHTACVYNRICVHLVRPLYRRNQPSQLSYRAEGWLEKMDGENGEENKTYYWLLLISTAVLYGLAITGTILIFVFFYNGPECWMNVTFPTINLLICALLSLASIHSRVHLLSCFLKIAMLY